MKNKLTPADCKAMKKTLLLLYDNWLTGQGIQTASDAMHVIYYKRKLLKLLREKAKAVVKTE